MPSVTNTGPFLIHAGGTRIVPTVATELDEKWLQHPQMKAYIDSGVITVEKAATPAPEPKRAATPSVPQRPVVEAQAVNLTKQTTVTATAVHGETEPKPPTPPAPEHKPAPAPAPAPRQPAPAPAPAPSSRQNDPSKR